MRLRLSQDAWVLLVLFLFLVGVTCLGGRSADPGGSMELLPRRTSYSARPGGLKALYDTLGEAGYPVSRHLQPLTLAPKDGTLFVVAPRLSVSTPEWQTIRGWVERGNTLVVAAGTAMDAMMAGRATGSRSVPLAPSFLSPGLASFHVISESRVWEREWRFRHGATLAKPPG